MQAAMQLAGYEASDADSLRKAIAKKKEDKLRAHRKKFIQGAQTHSNVSKRDAELIFEDWEEFARYGFNKSHAADYGVIAVQTAYLKYHYPIEYMTALLSAWKNDTDKVAAYVADCRAMGIEVLPPDVNTSGYDFGIEDREDGETAIRFGMGAIKNVGENPVNLILEARHEGPFEDLTDFARRVDMRQVGKRALESLVKVGSLERFGSRLALLQELERVIGVSSSFFRAKEAGQLMLFDASDAINDQIVLRVPPYTDKREELNWERELIGLYVSDHPLSPYQNILSQRVTHFSHQLAEAQDKEKTVVAGMVDRFRQHLTKKGNNMGFVTLEDMYGKIDLVIFPSVWEKVYHLIEMDAVIQAEGRVDASRGDPKILVDNLTPVVLDDLQVDVEDELVDKGESSTVTEDDFLEDYLPDLPFDETETVHSPDEVENFGQAKGQMNEPGRNAPTGDNKLNLKTEADSSHPSDEDKGANQTQNTNRTQVAAGYTQSSTAVDTKVREASRKTSEYHMFSTPLPKAEPLPRSDQKPRCIYITLNSCGDKRKDVLRLRRIHDILVSRPGKDQFAFRVNENGWWYEIDFPNVTTGLTEPLINKLEGMMGSNNIDISQQI